MSEVRAAQLGVGIVGVVGAVAAVAEAFPGSRASGGGSSAGGSGEGHVPGVSGGTRRRSRRRRRRPRVLRGQSHHGERGAVVEDAVHSRGRGGRGGSGNASRGTTTAGALAADAAATLVNDEAKVPALAGAGRVLPVDEGAGFFKLLQHGLDRFGFVRGLRPRHRAQATEERPVALVLEGVPLGAGGHRDEDRVQAPDRSLRGDAEGVDHLLEELQVDTLEQAREGHVEGHARGPLLGSDEDVPRGPVGRGEGAVEQEGQDGELGEPFRLLRLEVLELFGQSQRDVDRRVEVEDGLPVLVSPDL